MLIDNNGREQKVVYNAPKPQDMGRAEQMVIIGNMDGNVSNVKKSCLNVLQNIKMVK